MCQVVNDSNGYTSIVINWCMSTFVHYYVVWYYNTVQMWLFESINQVRGFEMQTQLVKFDDVEIELFGCITCEYNPFHRTVAIYPFWCGIDNYEKITVPHIVNGKNFSKSEFDLEKYIVKACNGYGQRRDYFPITFRGFSEPTVKTYDEWYSIVIPFAKEVLEFLMSKKGEKEIYGVWKL